MILSPEQAKKVIMVAEKYLGQPFDQEVFNCVHFVRKVYAEIGISLPLIERYSLPPVEFNLSAVEFESMPIGQTVFFKRKLSPSTRIWTHVAIIYSKDSFIHCPRRFSGMVCITPRVEFMEMYRHV